MSDKILDPNTSHPIVLIHGLWMNALCWEHWVERYKRRGCEVVAKSWPGLDGDIDAIRRDPSGLEHLGIGELIGQQGWEEVADFALEWALAPVAFDGRIP